MQTKSLMEELCMNEKEFKWFLKVKEKTLQLAKDNGIGPWSDNIECIHIADDAIGEIMDKLTANEAIQIMLDLDLTDWKDMCSRYCTYFNDVFEVASRGLGWLCTDDGTYAQEHLIKACKAYMLGN